MIKQEGGKETETEYFAALMTTLEVTQVGELGNPHNDSFLLKMSQLEFTQDEEMLSAVVRLLGLVIKKVPHPVLISRYSQV